MEWIKLQLHVIRSQEYIGCEPTQRAAYINLLAYCVDQENSGIIKGCKSWGDRRWMQSCGVFANETDDCPLFWFEGEDLHIFAYPLQEQEICHSKREKGRIAARKRWGNPQPNTDPNGSPIGSGNTEKSRVEKSRVDSEALDLSPQESNGHPAAVDPLFWIKGKSRLFRNADPREWEEVLTDHGESVCSEAYEYLKGNHKGTIFPNKLDEHIRENGGNGDTSGDISRKVKELLKNYSWPQRALDKLGQDRCCEIIPEDMGHIIELDGLEKAWREWAFNLPREKATAIIEEAQLV